MQEETPVRRRRRRRPAQEVKPEPVRIVLKAEEEQPEWLISAGDVSGAASRRTGTKKQEPIKKETTSSGTAKGSRTHSSEPRVEKKTETISGGQAVSGEKETAGPQKQIIRITDETEKSGNTSGRKLAINGRKGTTKKSPTTMKAKKSRSDKKKTGKKIGLFIGLGVLLVGIVIGSVIGVRKVNEVMDIKRTLDRGENVFYDNIYVNDIPLGGKTLDEAVDIVTRQVDTLLSAFRITLRTVDGQSWDITREDLQMRYDVADQLDRVWSIGHTGTAATRYEQVKELEANPIRRYTTMTYDLSKVNQILSSIKEKVDRPAVNATRVEDETKWPPYSYTNDEPGQTLDITGLNERITGMVDRLESGTVDLSPVPVEAQVTRAALEGSIVKLATYETAVGATSHEGRFTNIEIGTKKFNHLIIRSGESVSFNKIAGKRTEANGYVEAPEIAYGAYVMGIGGGICQVSSTLYNAVVNAGLEVTKRVQHSLPSSYVPMGQDATVSDDRLDFVFKNNTKADIFIETDYYKKKNYWYTTFTIYGRPDPNGYSYKLESQVREEVEPEPTYKPDRTAQYVVYDNETKLDKKGEKGYIVDVYLVTMDSNTGLEISRELKYTDNYKPVSPVYWVGVTPREAY